MSQSFIKYQHLENVLSERIQNLYYEQLKHEIDEITYHLFDNTLIITIEGALTPP